MKADIHPQVHPVIFLDTSTGVEFITTSTLKSEEKKKINGVDHYVIKVEISSSSHPFYTGKRKLVDTAGRVDKFLARAKKAQQLQEKKVKMVDKGLDEVIHKEEAKEKKTEKKKEAKKAAPKKAATKKTTAKKETKAKKEEASEE